MKTLKFRAFDRGGTEMIYSDDFVWLSDFFGNTRHGELSGTGVYPEGNVFMMQYTGLKDKNGVEIYKGDLLREPIQSQWDETNFSCFEVFFHDNDACSYHIGWQMDRMHNHGAIGGGYIPSFKPNVVSKMIVIGNIYENPELINQ